VADRAVVDRAAAAERSGCDGVVPMRLDGPWEVADTAAVAERMRILRGNTGPFDLAVPGQSDGSHLTTASSWPLAARHRIDAGP
jgi:hypothetical protein